MKQQAGYLLIICILIIAVISLLGINATYMFYDTASANTNFTLAEQAFFTAVSGLEKGTRYLLTPLLTGTASRVSCAGLAGNSNLTNSTLGNSAFTVTPVAGANYRAMSKLTSALSASASIITVASTAGFAPFGKIQIDNEIINYTSLTATSFNNLSRGRDFSIAAAHTNNTYVAQYQCSIDAKGGVPSMTTPTVLQEVQYGVQLQEAWAVGAVSGNNFVLTHWNNPTELSWTNASVTDATNKNTLLGISMLSIAEGWAVGTVNGMKFNLLRYLNGTWTAYTALGVNCTTQTLNAVAAISSQEAWAVGNTYLPSFCSLGMPTLTVLRWDGTSWTALSTSGTYTIPGAAMSNQNLNGIAMLDITGSGKANLGFAVGASGFILKYNGNAWTTSTSPTTQALTEVSILSANEAWAVGAAGVILKWNGSTWSTTTSPTTQQLNSIKMLDTNNDGVANTGCAVGNNGVALVYNAGIWTLISPGGGNLLDCIIFNANDIWAVGAAGRVTHWDGAVWTTFPSGVTTQLNGIAKIYPRRPAPISNWVQVMS